MGSAEYLWTRATELLDAATDALAPARTGHPAPTRIFVSHGEPAAPPPGDCEQLTVHLFPPKPITSIDLSKSGRVQTQCLVLLVANFRIQVFRCTSSEPAPSGATLDNNAETLLRDLWCMETWLHTQRAAGMIFDDVEDECAAVTIGEPRLLPDSGAAAGWELPVTLTLNDTGPNPAS